MEIKTKYNIGDRVYTLFDNKVENFIIEGINIVADKEYPILIQYLSYNIIPGENTRFDEERVFPTKEELLKSL